MIKQRKRNSPLPPSPQKPLTLNPHHGPDKTQVNNFSFLAAVEGQNHLMPLEITIQQQHGGKSSHFTTRPCILVGSHIFQTL